jgi:DNA (cytosine-5)-methyltransferase 1
MLKYIDLFCGLGAFHTAFRRFECVFACDIDEGARRIYLDNYGLEPAADIRTVNATTVPDHDILCAGFPCQPFSIAGNGEGFRDTEKGNLFYEILRIIDAKSPRMCILENVKNLRTHDEGRTYTTIETALTSRGYWVASKVIDASECGSPQARHRIFIVATKNASFKFPTPNTVTRPVSAILDPSVRRNDLDPAKYKVVDKPAKAKVDISKPHILADVFPIPRGANPQTVLKGGRQGERIYSTAAVGITVCASSGGPGAKTGLYKVGDTVRRLNVKETLGMFGFPTTYKFGITSDEDALFYLGNSIVVDAITTLVPAVEAYFRPAEVA